MFVPRYYLLCVLIFECYTKKPLRIIDGTSAREGQYPYVVRMEARMNKSYNKSTEDIYHKNICTASALSSIWVLTAGHCIYAASKHKLNIVIRYGHVEHSPHYEDTFSEVLLKIMHPLYSYNFEQLPLSTMKNDIGLLKTTPMNVKSFVKLSAVDFFSLYGYEAVLSGYGLTTTKLPDGKILTNSTLNLLKPLQLLNVLMYKCMSNLRPVLCLATKCGKTMTACPGDSGGPLIHPSGVVGVMSLGEWSRLCLKPTRKRRVFIAGHVLPISPYIEWIESYVTP